MVMFKGVHEAQASSRDWGIPGHARRPGYRHRGGQGRLARAHETGQPGRRRHAVMGVFLLRAPIGVGSEALAGRPRMEEFAGPLLVQVASLGGASSRGARSSNLAMI